MSSRTLASWLAFALLAALGAWLRWQAIGEQIVADDEIHSLAAIRHNSAWQILTHFSAADVSVPLAFLQMAIGRVAGLTETTVRLPMLIAGTGALVVVPLLVIRRAGRGVALLLLALLALSPQLVYYSRYGRPYMISALFAFVAMFAFLRWWERCDAASAVLYVMSSAAAVWFSLLSAPAVSAPLAVGAGLALAGRSPEPSIRRLGRVTVLAFALALLAGLLLLPAVLNTGEVLAHKLGSGTPDWQTTWKTARLFAGTRVWPLTVAFWCLAAVGLFVGIRRHFELTLFVATATLVQFIAVWIAAPELVQVPAVFARYSSSVLAFVLLFVAFALDELRYWIPLRSLAAAAAAMSVGLLGLLGPLRGIYYEPDNFTNHAELQYLYDPPVAPAPGTVPPVYCMLAREPGAFAIAEFPWYIEWHSNRFAKYQRIHRKEVYIAFPEPPLAAVRRYPFGPPFSFARFVNLEKDLEGRVGPDAIRYVVVHKDVRHEMASRYLGPDDPPFDVTHVLGVLSAKHGSALFEDAQTVVFGVGTEPSSRMTASTGTCP